MASDLKETFSVDDVFAWLNHNGFEEVSQVFYDEGIDGEAMSCLTENALQSLVTRIGPRMKLLKAIRAVNADLISSSSRSGSPLSWQEGDHDASGSCGDESEAPLQSSNENAAEIAKKQWTSPFPLPEHFQPLVQEALRNKVDITKQIRCKFIQTIYDRICLFTVCPTPDQRRDVCRAIITKFPFLADSSGGYEIWYRYLGDKIKNELRNEKTDPVVLARKRKNVEGLTRSPKLRAVVQRGIVNWAPPAVGGEDETSCRAHIAWMQKEKKKRQPNEALIHKKMELTYSFRRQMLIEQKYLPKEVQEKYPFLFDGKQLRCEYNRLMAEDTAADCLQKNLLQLAPKIIKVAEKRCLSSEGAKKLLNVCKPHENVYEEDELSAEDMVYVAVCLLPYLLDRKTKLTPNPESFLYQFGEAKEVAAAAKPGMAPFLIFGGTLEEPNEISIAAENRVIVSNVGMLDATESLMFLYYVCNLEYRKQCFNTFFFIQRHVMNIFDTQKVPTKVLVLMSELSKL